ncbi:hypothetical protein AXG93_2145s1840 [Marchantia polymorpha subsp. ruderalis]|uniref:Uncharacterized protein n=1 Tax=Marchantia polymorpha subsp. ruderalis TaxID=1480154 RepID=A0A176VYK7_MARPO|nr:hypothetical protein AXG93_2145s1840 [Marchantia polymorpha subsp. ruderalis]
MRPRNESLASAGATYSEQSRRRTGRGRSRRGPRVVAPFEATTRVNVEPASRSDEVNRPEDAVEDAHTGGSKRATSEEHEHGACGMGLGLGLRLRLGLEHEHEHVGDGSWVGEGHTVSRWNVLKKIPACRSMLRPGLAWPGVGWGGVEGNLPKATRRFNAPDAKSGKDGFGTRKASQDHSIASRAEAS